jgi:hypothetical protein
MSIPPAEPGSIQREQGITVISKVATASLFGTGLFLAATAAQAQHHGVNVLSNELRGVPTVAQFQKLLNPGDFVRDLLHWSAADPACDLQTNPSHFAIPRPAALLYANVAAAQGSNFVTLGWNNTACGQSSDSGQITFPNTDALRAEFAAYAVAVVRTVPDLAGVSIWSEMNGSWAGGYVTVQDESANYCLLANAVIAAIRQVDPTIPIAIGASVGWNIQGWFTGLFDQYGCIGKGDPTIWLDVHPYLTGKVNAQTGKTDWQLWNAAISGIRADGITNLLVATEWGGAAAAQWAPLNPKRNYIALFNTNVMAGDANWAGTAWFLMPYDSGFQGMSLIAQNGTGLTVFGSEYAAAYRK